MIYKRLIISCICIFAKLLCTEALSDIDEKLRNYVELTAPSNYKVEFEDGYDRIKIKISAFGEEFEINVEREDGVMNVKHDGSMRCYEGVVEGKKTKEQGQAFGTVEKGSREFKGQFHIGDETFFIDKVDFLFIYRASDVIEPSEEQMVERSLPLTDTPDVNEWSQQQNKNSGKTRGNICEMNIIVDNSLYKKLRKNNNKIMTMVYQLIQANNKIYDNQVRVPIIRKYAQFSVKNLFIASDDICRQSEHKNKVYCLRYPLEDPDEYLKYHTLTDYSDYCLSYLFTNLNFGSTLGVAYVDGICRTHAYVNGDYSAKRSTNTGFITVHDPVFRLSSAEITFAHEVGHNFGASHDLSSDCDEGFLMAPYAPNKETYNSRLFSPCSMKSIKDVMFNIAYGYKRNCFTKGKTKTRDAPKVNRIPKISPDFNDNDNDIDTNEIPDDEEIDNDMMHPESIKLSVPTIIGSAGACVIVAILVAIFLLYVFVEQRSCFQKPEADLSSSKFNQDRLRASRLKWRNMSFKSHGGKRNNSANEDLVQADESYEEQRPTFVTQMRNSRLIRNFSFKKNNISNNKRDNNYDNNIARVQSPNLKPISTISKPSPPVLPKPTHFPQIPSSNSKPSQVSFNKSVETMVKINPMQMPPKAPSKGSKLKQNDLKKVPMQANVTTVTELHKRFEQMNRNKM